MHLLYFQAIHHGTRNFDYPIVAGDQNEYPGVTSEAVRADAQEQHVHT